MDKEKEIEEMAMKISNRKSNLCNVICGKCKPLYKKGCYDYNLAKYLVQEGYGNVKQAITEFVDKLKGELNKMYKEVEHDQELFSNNFGIMSSYVHRCGATLCAYRDCKRIINELID